ncbi:MAG: NYN domain-containing protein [Paraburkholderia sp.]|uniref:NYN domain-containing protein n=1 Tax=Paraburkholderia sp. TaxID=1926495 RepID=UPI0012073553|nr:NYN domain-containing protein [Paraburkholderia sp.]TAM02025.1 MAG: NYN domain-containing protein [Paraburkholderia sp.]TAM32092.1 MAG: NYN domain-containing protein [Paraburkholderia sp.]
MASPQENVSMAVFCDFENVALGVRDAKIDRFDIKPVLERLLLKGSIVVKKAYCDWERYKGFKASMHEASFELIEIPHVRQSGKNSADIRLVVDALDLCYTKSHVDTFVIVSGDSDFSPLVSKLRENAKKVIGVGVKNSTSDLLVANCDEFIFYDDLVRELERESSRGGAKRDIGAGAKRPAGEERQPKADTEERKSEERKSKAIALAVETLDALVLERGDSGKIWASVLKSAIKRRRPDFNETRYGFRAFGNLLDEAQARGLLEVGRDEKSGAFVSRTSPSASAVAAPVAAAPAAIPASEVAAPRSEESRGRGKGRGKGRRNVREAASGDESREALAETPVVALHDHAGAHASETEHVHAEHATLPVGDAPHAAAPAEPEAAPAANMKIAAAADITAKAESVEEAAAAPRRARKTASRKSTARKTAKAQPASDTPSSADAEQAPAAKKAPSRARRTRTKATTDES